MSRVNDDAASVKGSGFHLDETRIYNILVCVSAILLIFINLRDSMGKYEAYLVFGEEEKNKYLAFILPAFSRGHNEGPRFETPDQTNVHQGKHSGQQSVGSEDD